MAERCHANCIEYARESARRGAKGELVERDGVLLYATASDFPVLANGAFRVDAATDADHVIDLADAWFADRSRGWSIGASTWADADADLRAAAERRGLLAVMDQPGMVCDARLPDAPPPEGIEVRVLSTPGEAAAFVAMADLAYTSLGLPAGVIATMAADPAAAMPPHQVTVGAFEGDTLLSGAHVLFIHGIAGVCCRATAEAARGRRRSELATRTATNLGFDGGAPYVTLQASPMGEPIYRRMGYRELYRYVALARFV